MASRLGKEPTEDVGDGEYVATTGPGTIVGEYEGKCVVDD
jgi:hypothetical protein